jgi:hypothetical protein
LASDLITPTSEISSEEEADTAARNITTSIALMYSLSVSKVSLSDINSHDLMDLVFD